MTARTIWSALCAVNFALALFAAGMVGSALARGYLYPPGLFAIAWVIATANFAFCYTRARR